MNFTGAVIEVLSMVKRPDKINTIKRCVNQALTMACMSSNFARDLQERVITIDPALNAQSLPLSEFERFRKFVYIRPSNRKCYVTQTDADKIFAKGIELLDKYYVAGDQVNFKLARTAPTLLVGWFAHPPRLTDAAPNFWLLDVCPDMIIDKAAALVFKDIGDDASARQKESDYSAQLLIASADLKYGAQHG